MLLVPQIATAKIHSFNTRELLDDLVYFYGEQLGRALFVVGDVESHYDPDAHVQNESEDSRGAWQVNSRIWGVVPFGREIGGSVLEQLETQLRAPAMRKVVEDTAAAASAMAARTGAPFVEAFDLVWKWGRGRAEQLVGAGAWSVDAIAARIAMLKNAATAAAWRARNAAVRAAWILIEGAVITAATGGAGALLLILLLLWLIAGSKEKRARSARIAGAGARALL